MAKENSYQLYDDEYVEKLERENLLLKETIEVLRNSSNQKKKQLCSMCDYYIADGTEVCRMCHGCESMDGKLHNFELRGTIFK